VGVGGTAAEHSPCGGGGDGEGGEIPGKWRAVRQKAMKGGRPDSGPSDKPRSSPTSYKHRYPAYFCPSMHRFLDLQYSCMGVGDRTDRD